MLYVALTRAKEKLILTGTVKDFEKGVSEMGQYGGLRYEDSACIPSAACEKLSGLGDACLSASSCERALAAEWEDVLPKQCVFSRRNRHGGFPA